VQAAELLGGFDGAGPIGFRGHIVPDERSRLSSLSMCRPLKVQGTSIAKAAQITLDFAMGLCATRGDRCP
jgi:hypothetical protein